MKNFKLFCATLFMLGLFLQTFGQNQSIIYYMDSLHVINNALAKRTYNGQTQYIMMPTQYNTTVANGTLHLLILDAATLNVTAKKYFTPAMKGAVINDIRVDANNDILFAGTLGSVGIYGKTDNTGNIQWLRKDSSFKEIAAMDYCPFTANERLLLCGQNSANNPTHGFHAVFDISRNVRVYDTIYVKNKDIVYYNGANSNIVFNWGIMLRYNSQNKVDIASFNAKLTGISSQSKTIDIPTGWHWHEGGGSITHVEDNNFVAAIDVRNSTMDIDGIFFIKFSLNTSGKVTVYDTRIISLPSPKVVVKDILYVNDIDFDDVSYNVIGQYITNGFGLPFILKTDTSFTIYDAFEYMTFLSNAENCNFRLNKAVYCDDDDTFRVIASGAFDAYQGNFNTGGIYFTRNLVGVFWPAFDDCVTSIPLSCPTTSYSTDNITYASNTPTTAQLPYISINAVNHLSLPQEIVLCSKGGMMEERNLDKVDSDELGFSVQGNKIILENVIEGSFFEIYNTIGKRVMSGQTTSEINITFLHKGLYIIRVMNGEEVICTDKFVR